MKKNKVLVIVLIIVVSIIKTSLGQVNPIIPKFNYIGEGNEKYGFEGYVRQNFKDSLLIGLNDICIDVYGSVKFSFDEKGNIADIIFSSGTPKILAERLKVVIKKSNDFWDKEGILKIGDIKREYLLPFIANYMNGSKCFSTTRLDKNRIDEFENQRTKAELSLAYMFDFEEGRIQKPAAWYKSMNYTDKFEGVILRPTFLINPSY